ncbi:MAG: phosphoglycerate kinase [Candidatus Paceibacteria bacterium]|jgi:phosphoglycerate kinase
MNLDVPGLDSLDLQGKRVLIRVDFNVPMQPLPEGGFRITDDTRIRRALPTIQRVQAAGGKPILLSHLGRPMGEVVEALRLDPVGMRLAELSGCNVLKVDESTGPVPREAIAGASDQTIVLLENVRFHKGETKGEVELVQAFAALGDCFINDAFGTSHRDHASVAGLARVLPAAAGDLLLAEIAAFRRVLENPARPLVAILGGAKVSDKLTVIDHLLDRVDTILVGGGMAYTFLKARGEGIGNSLVQDDQLDLVRAATAKAQDKNVKLLLPTDHVVAQAFDAAAATQVLGYIPDDWMALDIGPKTSAAYCAEIAGAKTVVWNGPMGVFELKPFRAGTESVGRAVADCAGYCVVGGGDSVAAVEQFGLAESIDHISTGGGASLELLEGRELPGIAVLGS